MKYLLLLFILYIPFVGHAQTKYQKWKSDSTRHHDSTFKRWDTALFRLKKEFRLAQKNMETSKSKEDSTKFNNLLDQLLFKQRQRDDKNFEYGRRNNFKN